MPAFTSRVHGAVRLAAVASLALAVAACEKQASGSGDLPPTYSVSGTVSGAVAGGVTIKVQGWVRQATTDSLGRYTITGLREGTYTLEASRDGYYFTPATRSVTVSGGNVTAQDFTSRSGVAIAGKVTGDGREGVTVRLTGPAPATTTVTVTTAASGDFQFPDVSAGAYLVTPSPAGGWTFSPANILVTVTTGTSVTGADFTSVAPTFGLSGRITGPIAAGVTVTLSGEAEGTVVTDGSGNFAFTRLSPGAYVLTPSYPGFFFTPATRNATIESADVTGQDFVSAATHKIAGRISGDVLADVEVSLSGAATGTATTDASGYYEFPGLRNGSYVVTPSSEGYGFAPSTRTVTLSGADVTSANFTASASAGPATYAVSGSISGAILRGVTIALQGATTTFTRTDAAGAFRLEGVAPGIYLVIPTDEDHLFDPASRLVVVGSADVAGQTFTATVNPTARTITGNVEGAATAGVTVTLVGPSPATTTRTITTDASGDFAFRGLAGGLYLATPSLSGFGFTPADCLVTIAGPSVSNLQFTSEVAPHAISGKISGAVSAGILVTLSGDGAGTTVTAPDGTFTFPGLLDGTYTVSPALAGYYFSPVEAEVTLDGVDVTGVNFVSAPTHVISGHVSGDVLEGVTLMLSGAVQAEATTDVTGFYSFTGLPDGGYVVTPSLAKYAFDPKLLPVDLAGADVTNADFTATLIPTYKVSGTISGAVLDGVTVDLDNGTETATTTTDPTGAYEFTDLPNGSYMVIPSHDGHAFTPASRAFRVNDADVTGQSFTSAVAP